MSNAAVSWALEQPIERSSAKFLLTVLAHHVNAKSGHTRVFPSAAELRSKTALDRKTVLAGMQLLVDEGYIADTGQRVGRTGQVVVYELRIQATTRAEEDAEAIGKAPVESVPKMDPLATRETVPFFPSNSTVFPIEEAQFSAERGPKTGHGTGRNRNGTGTQQQHTRARDALPTDTASQATTNLMLSPVDISKSLIGWERDRGKKASSISASKQPVIDLAALNVTPEELRRAYDDAVADRDANDERTPINAGFIRVFVEKNRRPAPVSRHSNGHRDDDWHRTNEGIKRKAMELGLGEGVRGDSWEQLKARCWTELTRREQTETSR